MFIILVLSPCGQAGVWDESDVALLSTSKSQKKLKQVFFNKSESKSQPFPILRSLYTPNIINLNKLTWAYQ